MSIMKMPITCRNSATHHMCYNGRHIWLEDHDIGTESIAWELGDRTCVCFRQFLHWRRQITEPFSGQFYTELEACRQKRFARQHQRAQPSYWRSCALMTAYESLVSARHQIRELLREILQTHYGGKKIAIEFVHLILRQPFVFIVLQPIGVTHYKEIAVLSRATKTAVMTKNPVVRIPFDWLEKLYARGLGLIDRHIVIDILRPEYIDHFRATAERQATISVPWWLVFGKSPDPTRIYALILCQSHEIFFQFPAEIVNGKISWILGEPHENR